MDKQWVKDVMEKKQIDSLLVLNEKSDNSSGNALFSKNNEEVDDNPLDFKELIGSLLREKWLILFIASIILLIGAVKITLTPPVYQLNTLVQIKDNSNILSTIDPVVTPLSDTKSQVAAEIVVIKSRMVLGEAVDNLNMEIISSPRYFPFIGKEVARRFSIRNKGMISQPLFGYSNYAWGGEKIKVKSLNLPASWIGNNITLIAGKNGSFKVVKGNREIIPEGRVGKFLEALVEESNTPFSLFVSRLKARPGTHFTLLKQSRLRAITSLQGKISVIEEGKTGILNFTTEALVPEDGKQILNEISNIYVRMNVEQKSEEAKKTLNFLEKQLPLVKEQVDASTLALNEYKLKKGSVDLNRETEVVLDHIVEIKNKINVLYQQKLKFTPLHPSVPIIDKKIISLKEQLVSNNNKIKKLPDTQQDILKLSRDVEVSSALYTELLNQLQTIKVTKAGTVGDVRIIDYAVIPDTPVNPKKSLKISAFLLGGIILGIIIVLIRKSLNHVVENPTEIEKHLNIPVYSTIPHSKNQDSLNKDQQNSNNQVSALSLEFNDDVAIESLRSLRTTLHFLFLEAKNNIILISGPSPGIGKSFVSLNLAMVMANTEKKILLIDADMRKGLLHKKLRVNRKNGLSELILNSIEPADAIKTIESTSVDFISTGELPPNPSELLLHQNFENALNSLSSQYDLIIIDSSPILAVTDASIIGRLVGATLMVIKAGHHSMNELELSVKRFNQNNVDIKGIVLNDMREDLSSYGYGYAYEQYVYK